MKQLSIILLFVVCVLCGSNTGYGQENTSKGFLGVFLNANVTETIGENGTEVTESSVVISEVIEGTAAEKAGLISGDEIVRVNGVAYANLDELMGLLGNKKAGETITIEYKRNNEIASTEVVLGEKKTMDYQTRWTNEKDKKYSLHGNNWAFETEEATDKGYLGVHLAMKQKEMINNGVAETTTEVMLKKVLENGPAAKAGLQDGDAIVLLNQQGVDDVQTMMQVLDDAKAGDELKMTYIRNGEQNTTVVTLGNRPKGMAKPHKKIIRSYDGYDNPKGTCQMSSNRGCCTKQKANTNKAQLGVYIEDLSIEKAQEIKLKNTNGAYVSGLSNNSAAAEAGIQENDVIVTIDKTTINDYNGLVRVLANYQPNDVVKVKYVRNGKKQKTKVTLKGKEQNCCKIQTTCPKNEVEKIKKEIIIIQGDETQIIENDGEEMIFINGQDIDKESITRLIEGHNDNVLVKEMMIEVAENENSAPEKVKLIVIVTNPSEKETIILQEIIEENQQTVAKNINPTNVLTVNDLSFYPNPSDGKFEVNFNLSNKGNTTVRIVDLAGKMVFQEELGNFSGNYTKQIDISDKGKGVYLLQIVQDEKMMTKKILVQ